jgi:hypothetical protein
MRLTVSGERSILLGTFASHPEIVLAKQSRRFKSFERRKSR